MVSTPSLLPCLPTPAPPALPWMLHQDQKKSYKAVQSCEEGGSGGAYLEPLVALAQNGANMHNVLGPACIFLRKGFAESRQAVRKSRTFMRMFAEISTCTVALHEEFLLHLCRISMSRICKLRRECSSLIWDYMFNLAAVFRITNSKCLFFLLYKNTLLM